MGKAKKIGIGIGIVVALFFVIVIAYGTTLIQRQEELKEQAESAQLSPDQIKQSAVTASYDDLARYNEQYVGKVVTVQGKVLQVQNLYGDTYVLRVGTGGTFNSDDVVWINYAGQRVLEGDEVEVWGKVTGLSDYTAVLGNEITIPEIDALILDVVKKRGSS